MSSPQDDDDEAGLDALGDIPILELIPRFVATVRRTQFFATVGRPADKRLRREARAYLDALGFPHIEMATIASWRDAAEAAATDDIDTEAFEAEEQLRAAVTADAIDLIGEEALSVVLTHISAETADGIAEAALNAAKIWAVGERAVVNAAAGAAVQAVHQAALLIAAGRADEEHPFALKYRLYELGRWPIAVTGSTFNVF